jgi:hypothetical protein
LAAWWTLGASAAFVTIGIVYAFFGLWHGYVQAMFSIFKTSGPSGDIEIWSMPGHLIAETPLLLAVAVAGCSAILLLIKRDGFKSQTWSGCAPEAALMLLAITVSLIHPAGFRSGLIFFVPSAFLFAWRYLSREVANVQLPASTLIPIVSVLVFAHALPFGRAIQHLRNSRILRQERLMLVSETLSDKEKDWVFDGAGMLPTRAAIDPRIQVNSEKGLAVFKGRFGTNPPVIIVPGIPKEKMPPELVKSISSNYVALSEDFWLLGQVLPEHGGTFEVLHAGKYHIGPLRGSRILGTYKTTAEELMHPVSDPPLIGTIDCESLPGKPVFLSKGKHTISSGSQGEIAVIWLGPQSTEVPMLADGQSKQVFFNW